jgi:chromosome segregation ATPase
MRFVPAVVIAVVILVPSTALAQAPASPAQRDVMSELLTEVHGLRLAMERAATVGARIQLLVARVQMQEQRIAEASRRLSAVREEASRLETQITGMQGQSAQFEKMVSSMPREQREDMERMAESFKTQSVMLEKRRGDLANEESLLLQQVSADQSRWSDVNAQLDDIERSLAAPPKK